MELEQLQQLVIEKLDDMKAQDIKVIDVRGKSSITDLMIIATGNSTRHVKSLAQTVELAAKEAGVKWDPSFAGTDFSYLKEECEFDLIKKMENYHQLLAGAAVERAPQRVAKYAYELAALFHHFYRECRILGVDAKTTEARLGLITAVQYVLAHALAILGVSAPEHM